MAADVDPQGREAMKNPFKLDESQAAEWQEKFRELAQQRVDEEVIRGRTTG